MNLEVVGKTFEREIPVVNKLGLHARAASQLVKLAQGYPGAHLRLSKDGAEVNGKSIMGVLTLAAAKGDSVTVRTWGEGAEEMLHEIVALFANRFGESE